MLTIRLDSPTPLNDQIVAGIRALIAAGALRPGDELPPVRQLASDLGVNLNTIARAYRALESDGLVATARGRGTRVASAVEGRPEPPAERDARVVEGLRAAIADAKLAGLPEADVRLRLDALLAHFFSRGPTAPGLGGRP